MQARFENSEIMKLVFASNNQHKLSEVRKILTAPIEVVSLRDIGFYEEIEENGSTLEENSKIKANVIWQWLISCGMEKEYDGIFADDTGLEIDALGGQPGVYSARWAGEPSNDANNRKKALAMLINTHHRNARFRTVITWINKKSTIQVDGIVEGSIAYEEVGSGGFGYDAIFIPEGYNETFATLSQEVKNNISHRAHALVALRNAIDNLMLV